MKMNSLQFGILLICADTIQGIIINNKYKFDKKNAQNRINQSVTDIMLTAFGDNGLDEFDMYRENIFEAYSDEEKIQYSVNIINDILFFYTDFNVKFKQLFKIIIRYTAKLYVIKDIKIKSARNRIEHKLKHKFKTTEK